MGVAGSGKSTVGAALAAALGVDFVEGDRLHPAANVEKMAGGEPLDDDDRWPWLARVRAALRAGGRRGGRLFGPRPSLSRSPPPGRWHPVRVPRRPRRRSRPPARAATRPLHGRLDGRQPVRGAGASRRRRDRCRDHRRRSTGRSDGRPGTRRPGAVRDGRPATAGGRFTHTRDRCRRPGRAPEASGGSGGRAGGATGAAGPAGPHQAPLPRGTDRDGAPPGPGGSRS